MIRFNFFYPFISDYEYPISVTDPYSNTQKFYFYDVNIHYNFIRQKLTLSVSDSIFEHKYENKYDISDIRSVFIPTECTQHYSSCSYRATKRFHCYLELRDHIQRTGIKWDPHSKVGKAGDRQWANYYLWSWSCRTKI